MSSAFARLRRIAPTLVFLTLSLAFLGWVAWDAFGPKIVTFSPGADYWEHTANFRALLDHPFAPENPQLKSPASSPRFGPHFVLVALISRALGLDAIGAMGVSAIFNTTLFLAGIYFFFRLYFRARWAEVIGLIVLFASWWEGWHFSNVYQLKIYFSVAGYPSTAALGTTLLTFALALTELRAPKRRPLVLALLSLCWMSIFITHPLTAMMAIAGGILLAATEPRVPLERRLLVAATVVAGCALSQLWPYFSPWRVILGGSGSGSDWVEKSIEDVKTGAERGEAHQFYRWKGLSNNLGLALLGIPASFYLLFRPRYWFIPLGALAMATPFVANAYVELPLGHRFILLTIFFLQMAVVWLLLACLPSSRSSRWSFRSFVLRAVPISCVVSILVYFGWTNFEKAQGRFAAHERRYRGGESASVRYGRRVAQISGVDSVILADERVSWPIPTFGPKVVVLLHPNPLVPDEGARKAAVRRFFRSSLSEHERVSMLERYGVTHVLVRRGKEGAASRFLGSRDAGKSLPGGYVLYRVR